MVLMLLNFQFQVKGVINTNTSKAECEIIRKKINDSGVFVDSIATGMSWGVSPTSDDESIRKQSISLHQDAIKVASHLDCKALLFVPGVVKSPISPEIVRYDRALDRLREAINQCFR